jgi:hypothetical protein
MKRLLSIEWKKLAPYRAFRILIVIYLIGFILMPYSLENFKWTQIVSGLFEFPAIWFTYYFASLWGSMMLAIIVITFTCNEYSYGTQRQNVIDGLSRTDLVRSKFTMIFFLALGLTAIFTLNGLIAGSINEAQLDMSEVFTRGMYIPGFFLHAMSLMSFAFFLATLIRRTGISIFAFLAWFILEMIARGLLLEVADGPIAKEIADTLPVWVIYYTNVDINAFGESLSTASFDNLIPSGLGAENLIKKAGLTVLFFGLSLGLIRYRDL